MKTEERNHETIRNDFENFGAPGDGLTITGGTFTGAFNSGLTSNLNLFGGNFDGLDWWEYGGAANDLNIDSDKTVLNLKASKNFHNLRTGKMNISGDRGISLTKTNLSVGTLSGKATLNKDAFAVSCCMSNICSAIKFCTELKWWEWAALSSVRTLTVLTWC